MVEVLRWSELIEVCGSVERARTALRHSEYRRVLRDAYVAGAVADSSATRVRALARVLPPDVAASHWTALWACGLDVLPRDRNRLELLDVTVPRARHLQARPQIRTHCALVPEEELCEADGLLVVSAARAFVDVARGAGPLEGVALGDAALRSGLASPQLIAEAVERAAGLRWVTRARKALPLLDDRSESLMESRLRVGLYLEGGLALEAQRDLYDENGSWCGRADLFLDGVVVEYDGRESRLERPRFTHDRRRGNAFANLAVEVRRFTGDDYYKVPMRQHVAEVRRALSLAAERRPRYLFGADTLPVPKRSPLPTLADVNRLQARLTA
ncbi:MAG TPA: hypothetical protein VM097_08905 [Mycobacteriales bacterium]|nr:hypothetical protein [Mycobacteriales bacterium]